MGQNLELKFFRLSIFFISYTLIFFIFVSTIKYTLPFILAFLIALLLKKPTKMMMEKFNISVSIASLISTLLFWALMVLLNILLMSSIIDELSILLKRAQSSFTFDYNFLYNFTSKLQNKLSNLDINPVIIDSIKNSMLSSFKKISNDIISFSSLTLQNIFTLLKYVPYIFMLIIFTMISTYFITKELSKNKINNMMRSLELKEHHYEKISEISYNSRKMIGRYLLSYCFLILLSFSLTFLGFVILRIPYSLLLSILCALLDLLPVVGMPVVYVPLILIYFLNNNYFTSIALILLYIMVFISRQVLEPKIVSSTLNIHPLAILACFFIGIEANGITGMLYLIFMLITYTILKQCEIL